MNPKVIVLIKSIITNLKEYFGTGSITIRIVIRYMDRHPGRCYGHHRANRFRCWRKVIKINHYPTSDPILDNAVNEDEAAAADSDICNEETVNWIEEVLAHQQLQLGTLL